MLQRQGEGEMQGTRGGLCIRGLSGGGTSGVLGLQWAVGTITDLGDMRGKVLSQRQREAVDFC